MTPPRHPLQESSFDPLAMLRRNRGDSSDTRAIKLRMLWLRQQVPESRVHTELVRMDDRIVVMTATIALPDGGEAAGHAASEISAETDLATMIETTELRAIGRALDILGYVVLDSSSPPPGPSGSGPSPATTDERRPTPITRERPSESSSSEEAPTEPPTPQQRSDSPPEHVQALRALRNRGAQTASEPAAGPARPPTTREDQSAPLRQPDSAAQGTETEDEPELADIAWTAFWDWARATYQFSSRGQLEQVLGQSIANLSPGTVRQMLREHFEGGNSPKT